MDTPYRFATLGAEADALGDTVIFNRVLFDEGAMSLLHNHSEGQIVTLVSARVVSLRLFERRRCADQTPWAESLNHERVLERLKLMFGVGLNDNDVARSGRVLAIGRHHRAAR